MSEQKNTANDYALAKYLNERVWKILWYVADLYPFVEKDLDKINRNYIFLVQELIDIYTRNEALQDLEPKPLWQKYKLIEGYEKQIANLQDSRMGDTGQNHTASVKRLSIISGQETPELTKYQENLVTEADTIIDTLKAEADKNWAKVKSLSERKPGWQITEYTLTYEYGVILVNGVLRLKKAHDGSILDQLMLQATANPNEIFHFEPKVKTERNVSTVLSSANFEETLRKLFFPVVKKNKVLFRPTITSNKAKEEHVDTTDLDARLKELGATTEPL